MRNRYQRTRGKSKGKWQIVAGREVEVRMPLPLVEVWEELQAEVERLTGEAGLQILGAILEDEVRRRVGPRHRPDLASGNQRWGRQPGGARGRTGELPALTAGRADAAGGGGTDGVGAVDAEVPTGGRVGAGGLRDPEEQCEPAFCAGDGAAARATLRATPGEPGPGSAADRWDRVRRPSAGRGAGWGWRPTVRSTCWGYGRERRRTRRW